MRGAAERQTQPDVVGPRRRLPGLAVEIDSWCACVSGL